MKIIIFEPYDWDERYEKRSLTPNTGPVMVATLLAQAGHEVEVLSEYVGAVDTSDFDDADLVGISVTTFNANRGFQIARQISKPIVFGGFHASIMPEECLRYGDYVIRRDGFSIVDLAAYLSDPNHHNIARIHNLVFRKQGRTVYNQRQSRAISLVPDFSLVRNYYKLNLNRLMRIPLLVSGSRGCHFDCAFCSIKAAYPDFVKKDMPSIIEDIKSQIQQQHFLSFLFPKIIWITDDNFTSDIQWAKSLLREMAKLETKYKFTIQARVDIADDRDLLRLMAKAGIGRIYLGIESLKSKSLDVFHKKYDQKIITSSVKRIRSHDIDVHGLFIFGDDEFQKEDGLRIYEFVKRFKLSGVLLQPLTPYPGTRLFSRLAHESRIFDKNWSHYNGKVVFRPKHMTAADLQKEIYTCYRKVFSPLRVLRFFFLGHRGFRRELLGEAILRHQEWHKMKKYIADHLADTHLWVKETGSFNQVKT